MKKFKAVIAVLCALLISGIFVGCASKDNSAGDVNSNNGSLVSDVSSMMNSGFMSSMKNDVSSAKDDVNSFISSVNQ